MPSTVMSTDCFVRNYYQDGSWLCNFLSLWHLLHLSLANWSLFAYCFEFPWNGFSGLNGISVALHSFAKELQLFCYSFPFAFLVSNAGIGIGFYTQITIMSVGVMLLPYSHLWVIFLRHFSCLSIAKRPRNARKKIRL